MLLRRYREDGDRAALERVLARQYPLVERIVRIRLGGRLERRVQVADVVQETMLRALEAFESFELREDCRLIHWLARIAENEIARLARHHHAQKRDLAREVVVRNRAEGEGESILELASDSTAVPERLGRRELAEVVDECLSELPVAYREVVLLRKYAGGDWRFVAEELDRPSEEAARKLYERAREALSRCVRRRVGRIADPPEGA